MSSPAVDDVIPAEYMRPEAKPVVIGYIRMLRIRPADKRSMLARWGYMVGADVSADELAYVAGLQR